LFVLEVAVKYAKEFSGFGIKGLPSLHNYTNGIATSNFESLVEVGNSKFWFVLIM
jgi:hypothetical protein